MLWSVERDDVVVAVIFWTSWDIKLVSLHKDTEGVHTKARPKQITLNIIDYLPYDLQLIQKSKHATLNKNQSLQNS